MTKSVFERRDRKWHPRIETPDYKSSRLRTPQKPLVYLPTFENDFRGPVFGHDMIGVSDNDLTQNYGTPDTESIGPRILIHGRVLDENARPVPDTLIEIWQANAGGRYRHKHDDYLAPLDPGFGGCGRTLTASDGSYEFMTIQPGAYPWPNHENAWRPMHVHFSLFGQSFAQRLVTQMYFEGDPLIQHCPIVNTLNDPQAVEQLTAKLDFTRAASMDYLAYRFDIVMRGANATVFENELGAV